MRGSVSALATGLILAQLAIPGMAGDVSVEVLITRRLTKRSVTPTAYNLRGTVAPQTTSGTEPANELDRVAVILDGGHAAPPAPQSVTIEQRNSRFEPDLVVVPLGSTVSFPNTDPIFHNVFSLSRAQSFDLGFFPKNQSRSVKFNREGVVQVYCHIHASMYAAIVVTPSPWYGKPGADGIVTWNNVPAGKYRVVAWHKVAGMHQAQVDVPANGPARVTIRVPVDTEPHM